MFTKVKLTNFRKHTDRTFDFAQGLNVIRGPNEAAKSTIVEAITYALFGASSLRESLEKTVTWNSPAKTLKVELEFTINSQSYRITRSSGGAELFVGGKLTVTGQREVTKYSEALLGASADSATKLMMANQMSLRGALAEGPAAAVTLIENLANFDLIDSVVSLVQEKLPSGNTVALQAQIDTLTAQLEEPLVDGTLVTQAALSKALTEDADALVAFERAKAHLGTLHSKQAEAQALLSAKDAAEAASAEAKKARDTSLSAVGSKPVPVDMSTVPGLEKSIQQGKQRAEAQALFDKLQALKTADEWEGTPESLASEVAKVTELKDAAVKRSESLQADLTNSRLALSQARSKLITATHCAFFDKDLSDVPEVTTFNETWTPKIVEAESLVAELTEKIRAENYTISYLTQELRTLSGVQASANARASLYQKAASYIQLDEGFVPPRWSWTGLDLSKPTDTSAEKTLRDLKAAESFYQREVGRYQDAIMRAEKAQQELDKALLKAAECEEAAQGLEPIMEAYDDAWGVASQAELLTQETGKALREATLAAKHAKEIYDLKLSAREKLAQQKALVEQTFKSTTFNNALLKKLRAAKPQVANKLWAIVTGSISQTFSAIRGQASVVARGGEGFTVDGHSVAGLSGSTLDALGLAIRIALTKTFLPNTRFMILDESSAACDESREQAMVATVASADFDQVIWVTHSDAVESFASNVIQL